MSDAPFTLADSAVSMHEVYLSLVMAGFTEAQALHLVGQMLRPQPPNPS